MDKAEIRIELARFGVSFLKGLDADIPFDRRGFKDISKSRKPLLSRRGEIYQVGVDMLLKEIEDIKSDFVRFEPFPVVMSRHIRENYVNPGVVLHQYKLEEPRDIYAASVIYRGVLCRVVCDYVMPCGSIYDDHWCVRVDMGLEIKRSLND
jgi:hypothetical protein